VRFLQELGLALLLKSTKAKELEQEQALNKS
jgi:hypothetical protein